MNIDINLIKKDINNIYNDILKLHDVNAIKIIPNKLKILEQRQLLEQIKDAPKKV